MNEVLAGKKVVMIVANEFEDIELLYPLLRLGEEGARTIVVPVRTGLHPRPSLTEKPVTGRFGHPVPIPVMPEGKWHTIGRFEELDPAGIDCLLFPGGFSPDSLRRDPQILELIRQCDKEKRVLAAICHGPWVFISAGILAGKKVTAFPSLRDDLINAGAQFSDEPAIRDGHVITGRMPNDLPEFCRAIIDALREKAA